MREKNKVGLPRTAPLNLEGLTRRDFLKIGSTGLAGVALLGTAGCGSVFGGGQGGGNGGGGGGGGGGKSIVTNLGDTIRDLNSTTTTDSVSTDVLLNVMDGLYRLDDNQQPQPAIAEGVETSEDGLTYTFTLRDAQWSNGDPVTAGDFEYAWMRAIDPETAGQYAFIIAQFVKGATPFNAGEGSRGDVGINAVDDKTLEVQLEAPTPFFLGLTSFFTYLPQNQKFTEQQGDQFAQSADALLYNGPFVLTDFSPTEGITLTKNNKYWDKANVDLDKVQGRIIKEQDTAVNLYESGQLDQTEVQSEYVDEYKGTPDLETTPLFACFYMVFNYKEKFFQNENIRRAFQTGFDRDSLVNEILNNGSLPAAGYVPVGIAGPEGQTFREAQGPVMPEYNAQEAKKLFQKGVQEVGSNPTIELLAYDDSTSRDIATFLQAQFEENLGAKINVKSQPFDRKLELESNGEFQLSWQGWFADYNDPLTYLDLWLSDSSFNTQKYNNPQYDKLITQVQGEANAAKRMDLLLEAERLLVEEDAACAPMYFEGEAHIVNPAITKFVNQPYGAGFDLKLWRMKA